MPESHERDGSPEPAHDDDDLVRELRALVARVDPVPPRVLAAAYEVFER